MHAMMLVAPGFRVVRPPGQRVHGRKLPPARGGLRTGVAQPTIVIAWSFKLVPGIASGSARVFACQEGMLLHQPLPYPPTWVVRASGAEFSNAVPVAHARRHMAVTHRHSSVAVGCQVGWALPEGDGGGLVRKQGRRVCKRSASTGTIPQCSACSGAVRGASEAGLMMQRCVRRCTMLAHLGTGCERRCPACCERLGSSFRRRSARTSLWQNSMQSQQRTCGPAVLWGVISGARVQWCGQAPHTVL